jgi:hypothetical protein
MYEIPDLPQYLHSWPAEMMLELIILVKVARINAKTAKENWMNIN